MGSILTIARARCGYPCFNRSLTLDRSLALGIGDLLTQCGDLPLCRPSQDSNARIIHGFSIILDVTCAVSDHAFAREAVIRALEFSNARAATMVKATHQFSDDPKMEGMFRAKLKTARYSLVRQIWWCHRASRHTIQR